MRSLVLTLMAVAAGACAGTYTPPPALAGPAPAGALECALRVMTEAHFSPARGGASDGFVEFEGSGRRIVRVVVADGQMRVTSSSERADAAARQVFSACSAPAA